MIEIDALEGDDTIDVLATAPGVADARHRRPRQRHAQRRRRRHGRRLLARHRGHERHGQPPRHLRRPGVRRHPRRRRRPQRRARRPGPASKITESGGFTALYEGGCFSESPTRSLRLGPALAVARPVHRQARAQPVCAPSRAACKVYVTDLRRVLAAVRARRSSSARCPTAHRSGATATPSSSRRRGGSPADFLRQITLNGDPKKVEKRSIVLVFDATNWMTDQSVFLYAVDDTRAEGTRIVTASHSVLQPGCARRIATQCYDGAVVRNVEATVYDNDQPDVRSSSSTRTRSMRTTTPSCSRASAPAAARRHGAGRPLQRPARKRARPRARR